MDVLECLAQTSGIEIKRLMANLHRLTREGETLRWSDYEMVGILFFFFAAQIGSRIPCCTNRVADISLRHPFHGGRSGVLQPTMALFYHMSSSGCTEPSGCRRIM